MLTFVLFSAHSRRNLLVLGSSDPQNAARLHRAVRPRRKYRRRISREVRRHQAEALLGRGHRRERGGQRL